MEDRKYRAKFLNKADRTHHSAIITSPETNQQVKAYFIADNEQGVWRGEHGNLAKTSDGTTLANEDADVTGRAAENFASHYAVQAPRISGKTQADIQEEERTQRTAEAAPQITPSEVADTPTEIALEAEAHSASFAAVPRSTRRRLNPLTSGGAPLSGPSGGQSGGAPLSGVRAGGEEDREFLEREEADRQSRRRLLQPQAEDEPEKPPKVPKVGRRAGPATKSRPPGAEQAAPATPAPRTSAPRTPAHRSRTPGTPAAAAAAGEGLEGEVAAEVVWERNGAAEQEPEVVASIRGWMERDPPGPPESEKGSMEEDAWSNVSGILAKAFGALRKMLSIHESLKDQQVKSTLTQLRNVRPGLQRRKMPHVLSVVDETSSLLQDLQAARSAVCVSQRKSPDERTLHGLLVSVSTTVPALGVPSDISACSRAYRPRGRLVADA